MKWTLNEGEFRWPCYRAQSRKWMKKKKKSRIVCVSDGLAAHFSKWKPTQGGGQWQQQTQQQQKCRVVRGRPIFYPPADEKWPSIRWQDARARALVSRFSRCPLTNGSVVAFNSIPIDVNSLTFSTNSLPKNLTDFAIIFQTKFDNFFKKINLHTSTCSHDRRASLIKNVNNFEFKKKKRKFVINVTISTERTCPCSAHVTGITKINSSASDLLQWGKFACGPTFLGFDCVTLSFWVRVIVRICVEPASSSLETLNDKKSEQQHNGQSGDTADSHGSCSFSKGDFSRFKNF